MLVTRGNCGTQSTHQIKSVQSPQIVSVEFNCLRVVRFGNLDVVLSAHRITNLTQALMDQMAVRIVEQNFLHAERGFTVIALHQIKIAKLVPSFLIGHESKDEEKFS